MEEIENNDEEGEVEEQEGILEEEVIEAHEDGRGGTEEIKRRTERWRWRGREESVSVSVHVLA
jgi:hypothetical protein